MRDWKFVSAMLTPVDATVSTLKVQLALLTVLLIGISLLLAWLASRAISKSLIRLNLSAKAMAEGDYTVSFDEVDYGEIAQLSDTLNYAVTELAKTDDLRKELIANVSHDLRTPLTNINGSVGILMGKDQTLKPEVREQLYTAIDDDTNWLINMTENLLAATQLETDRTKLKTAPELLEDLFQSAVRQLDRRARDHHISVDLEDQTLMASMNAGMIQRVIINMMNNAIQYTPKDSHIILSGTRRKDWVEISVSDDGPGIPDEAKKHLFDLFYTAEQGKPDSKRGLGLGLHLCQSIVNAHGGTITVSDHAPSGTTFRFTLPAVRTDGVK